MFPIQSDPENTRPSPPSFTPGANGTRNASDGPPNLQGAKLPEPAAPGSAERPVGVFPSPTSRPSAPAKPPPPNPRARPKQPRGGNIEEAHPANSTRNASDGSPTPQAAKLRPVVTLTLTLTLTLTQTYTDEGMSRPSTAQESTGWARDYAADPYGNRWVQSANHTVAFATPTAQSCVRATGRQSEINWKLLQACT